MPARSRRTQIESGNYVQSYPSTMRMEPPLSDNIFSGKGIHEIISSRCGFCNSHRQWRRLSSAAELSLALPQKKKHEIQRTPTWSCEYFVEFTHNRSLIFTATDIWFSNRSLFLRPIMHTLCHTNCKQLLLLLLYLYAITIKVSFWPTTTDRKHYSKLLTALEKYREKTCRWLVGEMPKSSSVRVHSV